MPSRDWVNNPHSPEFSDTPEWGKASEWDLRADWRLDTVSAIDWLGHRFSVGDRVMYCIGAGRGQMMAIGTVQKMRAKSMTRLVSWEWEGEGDNRRRVNDVHEQYWEVQVQVLTEKTSGSWDNKQRSRPAWVNPMNITAIEGVQL